MIFIYKKEEAFVASIASYIEEEAYLGYGYEGITYVLENGDKIEILAKNNEDYEIMKQYRISVWPAVYNLVAPDALKFFRVIPKGCDQGV